MAATAMTKTWRNRWLGLMLACVALPALAGDDQDDLDALQGRLDSQWQLVKADKLHPVDVYSPIGIDPFTMKVDPNATVSGKERIERKADGVHVFMTAVRSHFTPDTIRVKQGERVHLHLTNVEQAHDATHGFCIGSYNVNVSLEPGKHTNIDFVADEAGVFPMYCTEFCSALHLEMAGYFLVEPQ